MFSLTVALFLGTLVPERSISSISSRVIMVFKNCPKGFPLKFQGASFGAIKFFWGKFFIGSLTGSGPEITIIVYSSRVFRPNVTYMACWWGSVVTEISVAWVLALKCQKKVRASSRKKAQLLMNFKYFKAFKFGWSHLKDLSKLFQNLTDFNSFCSKMAVQWSPKVQ